MKESSKQNRPGDSDTMRKEYDFSGGVRGVTVTRYQAGSNVIVVDPDLVDVFPDGESVNKALRAVARIIRAHRAMQSAKTTKD